MEKKKFYLSALVLSAFTLGGLTIASLSSTFSNHDAIKASDATTQFKTISFDVEDFAGAINNGTRTIIKEGNPFTFNEKVTIKKGNICFEEGSIFTNEVASGETTSSEFIGHNFVKFAFKYVSNNDASIKLNGNAALASGLPYSKLEKAYSSSLIKANPDNKIFEFGSESASSTLQTKNLNFGVTKGSMEIASITAIYQCSSVDVLNTVTYHYFDSTKTIKVLQGSTIKDVFTPRSDGNKSFARWMTTEGNPFDFSSTINSDLDLFAQWYSYSDDASSEKIELSYNSKEDYVSCFGYDDRFSNNANWTSFNESGNAIVQTQGDAPNYFIYMPKFAYSSYKEVSFTISTNQTNAGSEYFAIEGAKFNSTVANTNYKVTLKTDESKTSVYVDSNLLISSIDDEIALGNKALKIELNGVDNSEGIDQYSQVTFGKLTIENIIDINSKISGLISSIPTSIDESNCQSVGRSILEINKIINNYFDDEELSRFKLTSDYAKLQNASLTIKNLGKEIQILDLPSSDSTTFEKLQALGYDINGEGVSGIGGLFNDGLFFGINTQKGANVKNYFSFPKIDFTSLSTCNFVFAIEGTSGDAPSIYLDSNEQLLSDSIANGNWYRLILENNDGVVTAKCLNISDSNSSFGNSIVLNEDTAKGKVGLKISYLRASSLYDRFQFTAWAAKF